MLDAKIKFFDINRFGYYKYGSKSPVLGGITDTLTHLNKWAKDGREFVNTLTYQDDKESDLRNTYYCGSAFEKQHGDSLLTLWAEVPNDSGVIYGMPPLEKPGKVDMLTTGFSVNKAIPGFPCYFWFIPEENVFASIKFEHSLQGKSNLDNYINGFLLNKSPYRVLDNNDKVIGFSADGKENNDSSKISPKFYAVGKKYDEIQAELISNLHRITRILKREKITYATPDDRSIIERVFSGLLSNTPASTQERTIFHEMEFKPTETQLKHIVNNFNSLQNTSPIKNVGFKYSDGKSIWLSGASVAFEIELNVRRKENHIIAPDRLLHAIMKRRDEFINRMKTPPAGG
ncbi:hypothetical protein PO857_003142 [Pectobacterium carotovorum]|uniref:hypothetical protein n=1 Tax=Pectobacterium carotovorum TaxID=554 RepID=UPI00254B1BE5|nr:hypothetical protein [Pectobacterium carotovorum]MDK9420830.1 hypothetical protein [Pectobacterium carotovorum]